MSTAAGTRLGPYKIISLLGAGGMGKVYLAEDLRLNRKIALKLLPTQFTKDEERVRRFEHEARAASALNHPNILTIYEIGKLVGVHFIATEFIDGLTLRKQMEPGRMKLRDILEVAIQVAEALVAAHRAGITHRDIKPENIMLRPDGYIKVLDFGLAKLTERPTSDPEASTAELGDTDPGRVMGTAHYMSPEQAQGLRIDARTDIFSLGIVLYEMIAGCAPFQGSTASEVIISILSREPIPLTRHSPEAPAELERIVMKALVKDREERYQTARDLLLDLKRLKQRQEFEAELERSRRTELSERVTLENRGQSRVELAKELTASQAASVQTTSSAEYLLSEIRRHKRGAGVVLVALILSMTTIFHFARDTGAIESVAVLPFTSSGAGSQADWLSDDITASLINSLLQLPNLNVRPYSSVLRYKGRETDPQAAGNEVGVHAVLTGRITQHGDNLSISAELIDVRHNRVIWGEQYDRKLTEVLAVKEDISREITEKLRLRLSNEDRKRQEIYQLYESGRFYWNKRTAEGLKKAIDYFNQVIAKDPRHALAYAGLADSYNLLGLYSGGLAPKETYPKAKAAALKALEIDDTLAEAHTSLAWVRWAYDLDWADAEREFKRAIELKPNYATAHQWYADYLAAFGRFDEAIAEMQRAQDLDPLSRIIKADLGSVYYYARDYDQSIAQLRKTLEIDPNFAAAHWWLGDSYIPKGRYEEAIAALNKANTLSGGSSRILADLGYALAVSGRRDEALKVLDQLKEQSKQLYVSPYETALVYTGLGEKERALADLQKAFEDRPWELVSIKVEPLLDSLRAEPPFTQLLRRVGLTP